MTPDQAINLITSRPHQAEIRAGIELQNDHKIHVTTEGYEKKIRQIKGYENSKDFAIKKEMAKPITQHIYQTIINEQNRWVSTEVSKTYYFTGSPEAEKVKSDEFKEYLESVWKNQSIENFIKDFCKDALYSEFNGFVFIERTPALMDIETQTKEPGKPYIIFIPLSEVQEFDTDGNTILYLCYKMDRDDRNLDKLRFIDKDFDYVFISTTDGWKLDPLNPPIRNELGYVPAIQLSTKSQQLLVDEIKTSYIDASVTIADTYLSLYFEYIATCVRHGYPIQYITGQKCRYEDSEGRQCSAGSLGADDNGKNIVCPNCHGSGVYSPRDSGDMIFLPQFDADGKPYSVTAPGGYISSPVETIVQQRSVLEDLENKIYLSCLGSKDLTQTTIQTATERVINSKSLENINNNILQNIEFIETFCTDTIGEYLFGENYKGCRITYSKRFNLRSENVLLNEIKEAKQAGSSYSYLYELGKELIYARYSSYPELLERMLVLYRLEPYPILTSQELPTDDGKTTDMKMNFMDYITELEELEGKPIEDIYTLKGYKQTLTLLRNIQNSYFQAGQINSTQKPEQLTEPSQG